MPSSSGVNARFPIPSDWDDGHAAQHLVALAVRRRSAKRPARRRIARSMLPQPGEEDVLCSSEPSILVYTSMKRIFEPERPWQGRLKRWQQRAPAAGSDSAGTSIPKPLGAARLGTPSTFGVSTFGISTFGVILIDIWCVTFLRRFRIRSNVKETEATINTRPGG